MTDTLWLLVAVSSALLTGALATLHFALHDLSRGRLEDLADRASEAKKARAHAIIENVQAHLAAVALPRTLASLTTMAAAVLYTANVRSADEGFAGADPTPILLTPSIDLPTAAIALAAATLVLWVTSVIAHSIADHAGERIILRGSSFVRLCYFVLYPVQRPIAAVDEGVRRLAGPTEQSAAEQLEQELLDVVEEHGLSDDIGEEEKNMLEKVVEFRSTTVEQIMTPRTDIMALEYTDDLATVKSITQERGHSRVPVYNESLDTIVGILYAKDLLHWIIDNNDKDTPFVLTDVVRSAIFVPETKTVRELLTELLAQRVHIAMVADEYGGTAGLVTIEDIVEEIFGEIADEYDAPDAAAPGVSIDASNNTAEIDAKTPIDDANDVLDAINIQLPESDDYDTVGGFIVVSLGRIPSAGDSFLHERDSSPSLAISVLEAEPTRVKRVRVELFQEASGDADASSSSSQPQNAAH